MAIHVIGTYIMCTDLKDALKAASGGGRIVNTSSAAAYIVSKFDLQCFHDRSHFSRLGGYSKAKYAQTLLSNQLALEFKELGITVNCVHPGVVLTDIIRDDPIASWGVTFARTILPFALLTPQEGAITSVWVALSNECDGITGRFFHDLSEDPPSYYINEDMIKGHGRALLAYCKNLVDKRV